jgi:hypothetical protein
VPDDLLSDTHPALSWVDAFPWLAATECTTDTSEESISPWVDPIDAIEPMTRAERLADLSDLILERLTKWTIGQIFPTLPAAIDLASLPITNRARNALTRYGYYTAGDLQSVELDDLLDMRNVGIGTVDSILQTLADASTLTTVQILRIPEGAKSTEANDSPDRHGESVAHTESLISDLQTVATWYATLGMSALPLLNPAPPGSPPEVIKAQQRLELITANDVLVKEQAEHDAAELLQHMLSTLDHRALQILARRFFADRPETLDEIGADLGITRERIRQIESRARSDIVRELESGGSLERIVAAVRELVGTVLPLADLLRLVPALAHPVEAVGQPAWRVLDRLDDAYEIEDGWCAAPTTQSAQNETLTRLQEHANRHGVAMVGDLSPLNPNQSEDSAVASLRDWLSYCGYEVAGDWVFTRVSTVGDRAAAVLSVTGSPMSSQDILNRLGVERSLVSLRNAMGSDDRFERVDRDKWALSEWGMKSYTGIRALVREEVGRNGGEIPLETLIERITGRYTVSANSVIAYASALPFEARAGIVRFSTGERELHKTPERTRRLYQRADGWIYRVTVTKDHLRGSGSPAPVALANILGIQHGQARQLASELGPQTITWTGSQPAFGTIRRFLIDSDIEIDSEIFLVIGDNDSFRIEPIDVSDTAPLECSLRLVGVHDEVARKHPRAALATAIGLPETSSVASVIGGYRERGDTDIAELLLSIRDQLEEPPVAQSIDQSADIDEILDLL